MLDTFEHLNSFFEPGACQSFAVLRTSFISSVLYSFVSIHLSIELILFFGKRYYLRNFYIKIAIMPLWILDDFSLPTVPGTVTLAEKDRRPGMCVYELLGIL